MNGMKNVANKILLTQNIDINAQDIDGNTCLHLAINSNNKQIFKEILNLSKPNMEIKNNSNELPLWLALLKSESLGIRQTDILQIIEIVFTFELIYY